MHAALNVEARFVSPNHHNQAYDHRNRFSPGSALSASGAVADLCPVACGQVQGHAPAPSSFCLRRASRLSSGPRPPGNGFAPRSGRATARAWLQWHAHCRTATGTAVASWQWLRQSDRWAVRWADLCLTRRYDRICGYALRRAQHTLRLRAYARSLPQPSFTAQANLRPWRCSPQALRRTLQEPALAKYTCSKPQHETDRVKLATFSVL